MILFVLIASSCATDLGTMIADSLTNEPDISTVVPPEDEEYTIFVDEYGIEYIETVIELTRSLPLELRNPMLMYGKYSLIFRVSEFGYRLIIKGENIAKKNLDRLNYSSSTISNGMVITSTNEYNDEFEFTLPFGDYEEIEEDRFLDVLSGEFIHRYTVNQIMGYNPWSFSNNQELQSKDILKAIETALKNENFLVSFKMSNLRFDFTENEYVKSKLRNYINHLKEVGLYIPE